MTPPADPAPSPERRRSALDPLAPVTDRKLVLRWRERVPGPRADPPTAAPPPRRPRLGLRWARDPANPYGGSKGG